MHIAKKKMQHVLRDILQRHFESVIIRTVEYRDTSIIKMGSHEDVFRNRGKKGERYD